MTKAKKAPEAVMEDDTSIELPEPTMTARVLRDFWPTENEIDRVRKGTVIDVTAEELIHGMENGTLERAK